MTMLVFFTALLGQCHGQALVDVSAGEVVLPVGPDITYRFERPVRAVELSSPERFLAPRILDGLHVRLQEKPGAGGANGAVAFRFDEGLQLGPFPLEARSPPPCIVDVHVPSWARADGLEAELEQLRRELKGARAAPAVDVVGRLVLAQPRDRPAMFRVDALKVSGKASAPDVVADALVAYSLFDVVYLVVRIAPGRAWSFGSVTARGATVVGTFIDEALVSPARARDVVIALRLSPGTTGAIDLTLHDASRSRTLTFSSLPLQ